jgi:YD repeat-containing protein
MRRIALFPTLSVLLLAFLPTFASAQEKLPTDEYGKLLHETESVKAVDSGMFGEEVSLYNGATEFSATDLSIPGNSALPVAIGRRLAAEERSGHLGGFGDWSLDVPYLTGKVSQAYGWASGAGVTTRCSVAATPAGTTGFPASLFWQGWSMYIPGAGSQQMLQRLANISPPGPGGVVTPYLTKQRWYFTACPQITDGSATGEGFEVTAPDGTRYTFTHVINRATDAIIDAGYWSGGVNHARSMMPRNNVYFVATKVRDRFNNTVTYNWSGDKLNSISSSDGRSITLNWVGSAISSVGGGGRIVNYAYTSDANSYKNGLLSTVTLGDGSKWRYATTWATPTEKPFYIDHDIETPPVSSYVGCMFDFAGGATTFTVTHPSGATGVFEFNAVRHVRSFVPKECLPTTGTAGRYRYPPFSDVMSLVSRTVTGPGIVSPELRTYAYTIKPPMAAWGTNCQAGDTSFACSGTTLTTVVDPDGTQAVYTFGNHYGVNEGQQLKLAIGPDTAPVKTVVQAYVQNEEVANYPFVDRMGSAMTSYGDNFNAELVRPQKSTATTLDGATFARDIASFDAYASPTCAHLYTTGSVATGSPMGRYERTTYDSNTTLWVLSQVKKVELVPNCNAGAVAIGNAIVENVYDANANLQSFSRFGVLQQSYTYNGSLLATVTQPSQPAATLTNYVNGVPKNITLPDTRPLSATVDGMGLPLSVTDQNGYTSSYTYDPVGRLKSTTYPTGDSTVWNPSQRVFNCVTAAVLGLGANHCEVTSTTGNARTTVYYDAHLRPVVTLTEVVGDTTTRSYVVKRYDAVGRETFASFPLATLANYGDAAIKGTSTQYDGIGRPLKVLQDSELGTLQTTTEYLPGFRLRVTNPRGYQSTTEFQDFDEPKTDAPTRIVNGVGLSEQQTTTITRDVFGKPLTITRSGN